MVAAVARRQGDPMPRIDLDRIDDGMRPYLRDATIAIVPRVSDAQVAVLRDELGRLDPFVLSRRLSETTVLVQGIPVYATSPHDADAFAWSLVSQRVTRALSVANGVRGAHLTSIDVGDPAGVPS
jgi:hypothetical protein